MKKVFSLKYKLVLLILPLFLIYSLAQYFLFQQTVFESFKQIEVDDSTRFADQVDAALAREVKALDDFCRDWAIWDDTYAFAEDGNEDYISSNLYDSYVVSSEIHLFIVLNKNDEIVLGTGYDQSSGQQISLEEMGLTHAQAKLLLKERSPTTPITEHAHTGYINSSKGIMFFSARPILNSNAEGPPTGTIIMGRLLDDERTQLLATQTAINFKLINLNSDTPDPDLLDIAKELSEPDARETRNTPTQLYIYERFNDAFGSGLFLIEVSYPRTIINEGLRTTELSLLQSVSVGLLMLIGIWLGTSVVIVSPLVKITRHVINTRTKKDFLERLKMQRNDEIGTLSNSYDELLDRLSVQTKELEDLNHELVKISNTDSLTLLSNRRSFDRQFTKEIGSLRRQSMQETPARCLSLLLCDIDFFKQYNDTYGHDVGDECLKKVARAIKACGTRPNDFTARFGGEEFAMILPETPEEGALKVAEIVRLAVADLNIEHSGSPISSHVTISIGIATMRANDEYEEGALFSQADSALYQAKKLGRNRIEHYISL